MMNSNVWVAGVVAAALAGGAARADSCEDTVIYGDTYFCSFFPGMPCGNGRIIQQWSCGETVCCIGCVEENYTFTCGFPNPTCWVDPAKGTVLDSGDCSIEEIPSCWVCVGIAGSATHFPIGTTMVLEAIRVDCSSIEEVQWEICENEELVEVIDVDGDELTVEVVGVGALVVSARLANGAAVGGPYHVERHIEVGSGCTGDLDGDDDVDSADLSILLGAYGSCPSFHCSADFDHDGDIDAGDLSVLLGAYGACP